MTKRYQECEENSELGLEPYKTVGTTTRNRKGWLR